jgi:hypothetical protein
VTERGNLPLQLTRFIGARTRDCQRGATARANAPDHAHPRGRGLSNREMADTLVLLVLTTEAHVTHALTKLGLRSRSQLALRIAERGR